MQLLGEPTIGLLDVVLRSIPFHTQNRVRIGCQWSLLSLIGSVARSRQPLVSRTGQRPPAHPEIAACRLGDGLSGRSLARFLRHHDARRTQQPAAQHVTILHHTCDDARRLRRVILLHDGFVNIRIERLSQRLDRLHAETFQGLQEDAQGRLHPLQQGRIFDAAIRPAASRAASTVRCRLSTTVSNSRANSEMANWRASAIARSAWLRRFSASAKARSMRSRSEALSFCNSLFSRSSVATSTASVATCSSSMLCGEPVMRRPKPLGRTCCR